MRFFLLGLDHQRADLALRERFAFDRIAAGTFLDLWTERFPETEAVLVSTCNRTELYLGSVSDTIPPLDEILSLIAAFKQDETLLTDLPQSLLLILDDQDAAEHLFAVASSLESMVIGEPQILAQIKEAYQIASDRQTVGLVTHSAFQRGMRSAKRVTEQTRLFRHRVSIPSIAVNDFALELFETLSDKITIVLGAGEMAEETLHYLQEGGAKKILIANRTRARAEKLAEPFDAEVIDWDARFDAAAGADLMIAACTVTEPLFNRDAIARYQATRRGRPLFLLDLAVPRNFDPDIRTLENVYLYSIDDLSKACERNRERRLQELPKAQRIVRNEASDFWHDLRLRESGETIRLLRSFCQEIKSAEFERLLRKCPELTDGERKELNYSFDRLINKILHPPMVSLRDNLDLRPRSLLDAVTRLFRLK